MADDADNSMTAATATVQEQEWSRSLARETVRRNQIKAVQQKTGSRTSADVLTPDEAGPDSGASALAKQAYTRAWQWAEEGVQDFALSFADLMLISGPAAVALFVMRFVGGNLMGGSGTVTFQGVSVPRVPGYATVIEGVYKFGKILLIGLVTSLIYSIIIFLIALVANPDLIVQIGLCNIFSGLMNFFGSTACAGTP